MLGLEGGGGATLSWLIRGVDVGCWILVFGLCVLSPGQC